MKKIINIAVKLADTNELVYNGEIISDFKYKFIKFLELKKLKKLKNKEILKEISYEIVQNILIATTKQRSFKIHLKTVLMKIYKKLFDVTSLNTLKNLALKEQEELVSNNYYTKNKVFTKDEIFDVAQEIVKEFEKKSLELKVKNIEEYLHTSYRQAYKIYTFIQNNKLLFN